MTPDPSGAARAPQTGVEIDRVIEQIAAVLEKARLGARHHDWCDSVLFSPVAAAGSSTRVVWLCAPCTCHAAGDAEATLVLSAIQQGAIPRMVRGVNAKHDAYTGGVEAALASLGVTTND